MSYDIEIYEIRDSILSWYIASSHSLSEDRDIQYSRFLALGILPEKIRNKI